MNEPATVAQAGAILQAIVDNVERVITGKRRVVELAAVALGSGGNLLLEDVPGVGKTVLARALARSIDGRFARVQGAPDLLPADITGSTILDDRGADGAFRFVPGPIFANVVLVDELNRTTPRTQAALLEAMEEHQVSVDGTSHRLPEPHLVIATQNPLEHVGTFPLPESQLDRFAVATGLGYPELRDEVAIIEAQVRQHPLERLGPVVTPTQVAWLQQATREVVVSRELVDYAVRLVAATRTHEQVALGASPRATVQLVHAGQALAALRGRDHVLPDDVKALAAAVLPHRLVVRRGPGGDLPEPRAVVAELLQRVPMTAGALP